MKKTYIAPEFHAVKFETPLMQFTSTLNRSDEEVDTGLSKGFQGFTMEDDTEE